MGAIRRVVVRDKSSGRYHIGTREDGGPLLTAEADNLDDAGVLEELDELPDDVPDADLCERCWSGT